MRQEFPNRQRILLQLLSAVGTKGSEPGTSRSQRRKFKSLSRKKVSQGRSNFPSRGGTPHGSTYQRLGKFDADQVVTLTMGYPDNFSAQIPSALGNRGGSG